MITFSLVLAVIAVVLAVYVLAVMNAVAHAQSDAQSYAGSIERAKTEWRAAKQHHDESGEHTWCDATGYGDTQRRLFCEYCSAKKEEPFEWR